MTRRFQCVHRAPHDGVEGEATARYLADESHTRFPTLTITRIATGVPAGSDIEYADEITMTRALENRRAL